MDAICKQNQKSHNSHCLSGQHIASGVVKLDWQANGLTLSSSVGVSCLGRLLVGSSDSSSCFRFGDVGSLVSMRVVVLSLTAMLV